MSAVAEAVRRVQAQGEPGEAAAGVGAGEVALLLRPIAALLLAPPAPERLAALAAAAGELAAAHPLSADLAAALAPLAGAAALEIRELDAEYHRLLVVPGGDYLAPFESVHGDTRSVEGEVVSGLLSGPSQAALRRLYAESGFEVAPEFVAMPDHAGMELGFLACLSAREAEAEEAGDAGLGEVCRSAARRFIERHPGRWIPALAERARKAQGRFTAELLEGARQLLRADLARLGGSTETA